MLPVQRRRTSGYPVVLLRLKYREMQHTQVLLDSHDQLQDGLWAVAEVALHLSSLLGCVHAHSQQSIIGDLLLLGLLRRRHEVNTEAIDRP